MSNIKKLDKLIDELEKKRVKMENEIKNKIEDVMVARNVLIEDLLRTVMKETGKKASELTLCTQVTIEKVKMWNESKDE